MKRTVKLFIILVTFSFSTNTSFCQNNVDKTINLNGNSKTETITINVGENQKYLDLNIKCEIEKGFVFIEILDPNQKGKEALLIVSKVNKKVGVFSLVDYKHKKIKSDNGTDYEYRYVIVDTLNTKKSKINFTPIKKVDYADGEINRKFSLPTEGDWTIQVKSDEGKGKVSIKSKTNQ